MSRTSASVQALPVRFRARQDSTLRKEAGTAPFTSRIAPPWERRHPCWADLTPEQYRERIAELVEEIESEARADREARGIEALGVEAILKQDPHTRPNQTKKSAAPAYHAATKAARMSFWESYSAFVAAFREAADKLKAGDRTARFPLGSFPPALPFVSAYPSLPP